MSIAKAIELRKLKQAIDKREEAFVLFNKLEELRERIDNMKSEKKLDEEIEVELEIL